VGGFCWGGGGGGGFFLGLGGGGFVWFFFGWGFSFVGGGWGGFGVRGSSVFSACRGFFLVLLLPKVSRFSHLSWLISPFVVVRVLIFFFARKRLPFRTAPFSLSCRFFLIFSPLWPFVCSAQSYLGALPRTGGREPPFLFPLDSFLLCLSLRWAILGKHCSRYPLQLSSNSHSSAVSNCFLLMV